MTCPERCFKPVLAARYKLSCSQHSSQWLDLTLGAMANMIEVSLQGVDGSLRNIQVEPGTTVANIVDPKAIKLPAGFHARLVTRSAQEVAPDAEIWEPQAEL